MNWQAYDENMTVAGAELIDRNIAAGKVRCALLWDGYRPDIGLQNTWQDIQFYEVFGDGYEPGGVAVRDGKASWVEATIAFRYAVLYGEDGRLITWCDISGSGCSIKISTGTCTVLVGEHLFRMPTDASDFTFKQVAKQPTPITNDDLAVIPAGTLLSVEQGVYDCHSVLGLFRVLADIDTAALRAQWLAAHPNQAEEGNFDDRDFLVWVASLGLMEPLKSVVWHLSDEESACEMSVCDEPAWTRNKGVWTAGDAS